MFSQFIASNGNLQTLRMFKEFVTFSEGNSRGSTKLFGHMSTLLAEQHNHENVEVGQQHSFRDVHPDALVKLFIDLWSTELITDVWIDPVPFCLQ